jgi:hypothetical protein
MGITQTLALSLGPAWVSGINLYAAVATLGLIGRFGDVKLPGSLGILTEWWVIALAVALYLIEFFADKIPYVDSTWDAVHTFVRPPAGAALAAAAWSDSGPAIEIAALLIGGGLAAGSHTTKASTRLAINTSPEPFSNIAASIFEDVIAVGTIVLAFVSPVVMLIALAMMIVAAVVLVRLTWRFATFLWCKLRGKRASAVPSA